MADEIQIVVNAVDNFSGVLGNFGNIMTGLKSTIDLVTGAFQSAADFVGQFVDSAADSELAVTKMETVLKSTGDTVGLTSQRLQDLAVNMMNLSGNSDEAEMAAEAMLLRYESLNKDTFPIALKLVNDLSASLGIDLTAAARMVGMALDDPTQGVGRLNTQFRIFNDTELENIKTMAEHGDVAGAQAVIIDALTQKFGGAAAAVGFTFTGALNVAKENLDNIKEMIGGAFLPVLTDLLDRFTSFANQPEVIAFFQSIASSMSQFISSLDLDTKLTDFLNLIKTAMSTGDWSTVWDTIKTQFSIAWNEIWTVVAPVVDAFLAKLFTEMEAQVNNWVAGGGVTRLTDLIFSNFDSPTVKSQAANAFVDLAGSVVQAFGQAFLDIANRLEVDITNWVRDALNISAGKANLEQIGADIVDGITAGFTLRISDMFAAATNFWQALIAHAKLILGISSPSTVFMQIGSDIVQGLINGFLAMAGSLIMTIENIVKSILGIFAPILDLLGIDTSGLTGGATQTGTVGGRSMTGTTAGTGLTSSLGGLGVTNNYYGPVYFMGAGEPGAYYDCPYPSPLMQSGSGSIVTPGY